MAPTKTHYGWIDHSGERTRTQVYLPAILADGSNYDTVITDALSKEELVRAALDLITLLNETHVTVTLEAHKAAGTLPAAALAQREIAIRWTYVDNVTGKYFRFDTPAPVDAIVPTGSDDVNMAAAAVIAFTDVIAANCVSPDGNAITVVSARLVGRRS